MSRKAMCAVPPMGWNSWNTFTEDISEDLIRETVDAMKEQGLLEAGYEYVVIDDCWSLKERERSTCRRSEKISTRHESRR